MKDAFKKLEQWLDSWTLSQAIVLGVVVILLVIATFWKNIESFLQ